MTPLSKIARLAMENGANLFEGEDETWTWEADGVTSAPFDSCSAAAYDYLSGLLNKERDARRKARNLVLWNNRERYNIRPSRTRNSEGE
jgi:hypothetical protein